MNNRGGKRQHAIAACPVVDRREHRAHEAVLDASDLAIAVRDVDPREVWGTLALWAERDPLRLFAAVTALAAMVPIETPVSQLLAWTDALIEKGAA